MSGSIFVWKTQGSFNILKIFKLIFFKRNKIEIKDLCYFFAHFLIFVSSAFLKCCKIRPHFLVDMREVTKIAAFWCVRNKIAYPSSIVMLIMIIKIIKSSFRSIFGGWFGLLKKNPFAKWLVWYDSHVRNGFLGCFWPKWLASAATWCGMNVVSTAKSYCGCGPNWLP